MSQQLSLVEYPSKENALYEPEKTLILSAFLDDEIAEALLDADFFEDFKLFEDETIESWSVAKRIKEADVGAALERLASMLFQLIESDSVQALSQTHSEAEVSDLMRRFQSISGVYGLIKLKRDNFSSSSAVVVLLS